MSATISTDITGANLEVKLAPGSLIINDYQIDIEPIEGGNRLTVRRGKESKTLDILNGANVQNVTISEVE